MIVEIPIPFKLYRADSELPPEIWDNSYSEKTNYGKKYGAKGPKNKAGLLFFHDHVDISHSYGKSLLKEINNGKTENLQTQYFITETQIIKPIRIIDFSKCHSMFMMIDVLLENEINILSNDFINHHDGESFLKFLKPFNDVKQTCNSLHALKIKLTSKGMEFDYSYFGQVLTDFENGIEFKKLLVEKEIDGYRWREHNDPRGLTYCLMNPNKISNPTNSTNIEK
jgi:hypothetical protein